MRFIGNKENIINKIYLILQSKNIVGEKFFDFFSGTTNVAKFYKKHNYQVFSSDFLYFSYCLQKAYIENNEKPKFLDLLDNIIVNNESLFASPLEKVLNYLNNIERVKGFIYENYAPKGSGKRMYFSDDNAMKIDAIRTKIESWKNDKLITNDEYYILLSCLIETVSFYANVAGVYAAFQKKWDPRALKPIRLREIEIINNKKDNKVYNVDSLTLCKEIETDILYLDPPYNERQYAPNYHLIETIARYDNPEIKGVTGMRDYENQKSSFCSKNTAIRDLEYVAKNANYKYLVLSYNSEGIMSKDEIIDILSSYGKVDYEEFEYTRFKSNSNGLSATKKNVYEQLYILTK
jgi:adenine-specific DNA-methyltransferase